ncbi:MAG TPA: hypothetical protein VGW38_07680 [Chloroflexota bacterium]|nr:hypothetical protein [Chloroflexota bacterium]
MVWKNAARTLEQAVLHPGESRLDSLVEIDESWISAERHLMLSEERPSAVPRPSSGFF